MPSTLEIYEHLKPKLGERETRELLEWIESEKTHLTTKEDLELAKTDLKKDMETMRIELKKDMETMRIELKKDMETMRIELTKDMESLKVGLLKWIFASWLTLALAILGLYFKR